MKALTEKKIQMTDESLKEGPNEINELQKKNSFFSISKKKPRCFLLF